MTVDYGQRHAAELAAARRIAERLGANRHLTLKIDLTAFGGSALTDRAIDVPTGGPAPGIPVTYVPARNTIFLSFALGWAEVLGAFDIFIGVNALDHSGYPDCRPEFIIHGKCGLPGYLRESPLPAPRGRGGQGAKIEKT